MSRDSARATRMKWAQVRAIGLELPEVSDSTWYQMPSLAVRGRSFAGFKEELAALVIRLESNDEQERLLAAHPDVYFITDHYVGSSAVLARLTRLTQRECRLRLERGWRLMAPKSIVKRFDPPAARGE